MIAGWLPDTYYCGEVSKALSPEAALSTGFYVQDLAILELIVQPASTSVESGLDLFYLRRES